MFKLKHRPLLFSRIATGGGNKQCFTGRGFVHIECVLNMPTREGESSGLPGQIRKNVFLSTPPKVFSGKH